MYHEKPESYPHFSHVDIVVLPRCAAKELDELEARLQIERDIRSDYSWHAEATMLMEKQKHFDYTTTELATLYRKSKREIEELFEIRDLGAEYLSSKNKKNLWSLLDETEHTFKKLNKSIKEQSSSADRELLKGISFAYIEDPDAAGERQRTDTPHPHLARSGLLRADHRRDRTYPEAPCDAGAGQRRHGSGESLGRHRRWPRRAPLLCALRCRGRPRQWRGQRLASFLGLEERPLLPAAVVTCTTWLFIQRGSHFRHQVRSELFTHADGRVRQEHQGLEGGSA